MQKDVHKSLIDAKRVAVFECKPNKDKDEEARDNSEAKDTVAKYASASGQQRS
jgi:hypothetical protein